MAIQTAALRWQLRGLPRVAWALRRAILGSGERQVWYQRRFRFVCDCDSRYGVLQALGFEHRAMLRLLNRLIASSDEDVQFFDVGANVGIVSLLACSIAPSRVHAQCFEPNPRALERLRQNVAMNLLDLRVNPCALGDRRGTADLVVGRETSNSTLVPGGFAGVDVVGHVNVELRTLDDYCIERDLWPTILKVDVEGSEPRVFRGAQRTLSLKHPVVIAEVNSNALLAVGSSPGELLDLLHGFGYQSYLVDPRQVGLCRSSLRSRQQWRGLPETRRSDFTTQRLCDVVAIPAIGSA